MAATMTLERSAKILPLGKSCASVDRTDRKNRLPTLTSAEIEDFFDHACRTTEQMKRAA